MKLKDLIRQMQTNYYKMLVIVDNGHQPERIIEALQEEGWAPVDVTEAVLKLVEGIPENKVKVRIGGKLKEWFQSLPDRLILYNTNILYSPELGRLNPVGAFKYKSREKEIIVLLEGHLAGNRIQYSQYGRPDYTEMDVSEVIHARMEDIDG
ncbi:MAG: BREX-3 system P-loop-containing protein BrxF [Syntrophothermus sp.]|uniref:BREX-3 system P-loop-containing protein BrxF n=1 Tax=Syntrophothermus sp. TaxID=2736299 RepID=UPI00257AF428|nr:BREX-3 system P-loop-containing protein BrxF [Syntrophothermus sp.]NSW83903.1 BREX-3 system P-loop-containing protein BrxF [Syntrophothermus sp.]